MTQEKGGLLCLRGSEPAMIHGSALPIALASVLLAGCSLPAEAIRPA